VDTGPVHVVPPFAKQISYHATPNDVVALCTAVTYDDGSTPQWYESGTPLGSWQDGNPNSLGCTAITIDPNPYACPVLLSIPVIGQTLADIWQDCGPYDPILK
jgi:hypothetical protein